MRIRLAALLACLGVAAAAEPPLPILNDAAAAARRGDRKRALKLLAEASGTKPGPEQRENIALLYADLKEYGVARSLMNDRIRESPRDPRLRLYLAGIHSRAGDRGATIAALDEARARGPNAVDRRRAAFVYQDMKEYGPARELLDALIKEAPRDLDVRLDRASLAAQEGVAAVAREHLAEAAKLEPGAGERLRMATLHQGLRDFGRARALLDGLVEESPADAGLRFALASLAAASGDRAAALESLAAARKRGLRLEDRPRAAALYEELKEYGPARAALEDIVRDEPKRATPRLELARFDAHRGERAAALETLAAARRLNPDMQERQRIAQLYEYLREYKTAGVMIDELIKAEPQNPDLWFDRAAIAAGAGDRRSALAFLSKARQRAPDPDALRRVAALYDRLEAPSEARAIREALERKLH